MSDDKDKIIEGHDYDGIQELDNPLPRWWLYLFYVTIVFAFGYYGYYELMGGPSSQETLEKELAEFKAMEPEPVEQPQGEEVDVQALLADSQALQAGQTVFGQYCVSCHGQKGEGGIGPNLTDKYWIHSKGDFAGVLIAFRNGFPQKGMPPWGGIVPADKHNALAAYVVSLQGTNPSNGKEPQGELIE